MQEPLTTETRNIVVDYALDRVRQALADDSVTHYRGRKFLFRHLEERRIIWIPSKTTCEAPNEQSGIPTELDDAGNPTEVIVPAWQTVDFVRAFIIAETEEAVDCLFRRLLAAYQRAEPRPRAPGPFTWRSELEGKAGETLKAPCVEGEFAFTSFVTEETSELTFITAEDHTCQIVTELPW